MSTLDSRYSPDHEIPAPDGGGAPSSLDTALERAAGRLSALQRADGHWCAELEGDSILESEYILTLYFLGRGEEQKVAKAARTLRRTQLPDGGWTTFPGGEVDVNPTVKAYFALKLSGDPADAPHMLAARRAALAAGGLEACNSFTRIYLAIFGQYPWERCPAVPPELVLLPSWMPCNIYDMSAWSRAIVVPLSILWALKPRCEVPADAGLGELWSPPGPPAQPDSLRAAAWGRFFRLVERALKLYERAPLPALRRRAIARARSWTVERLERGDGLAAIFPPIVNSIFALRALGLPADDPLVAAQVRQLERLGIEEGETLRVQPCFSAVWDTAISLGALLDAGLPSDSPRAGLAADWLLEHEVRTGGDWQRKCPGAAPGGWCFEYANDVYPDCDDTSQVVITLSKLRPSDPAERGRLAAAVGRGVAWLRALQCRAGGWGAFDKDCDREFLTFIPFADHNAMIDPPTVDVTARVIEALLRSGSPAQAPEVSRGVEFIHHRQEVDGSWYGRWGCNYIYGTWLALSALRYAGEDTASPTMRRGADWLRRHQNEDGGWGELPTSYVRDDARGRGPSTACQTAWALLGSMAAGEHQSEAVRRGLEYLLRSQQRDGGWTDEAWTGTGFPGVFYLRYHLYATYYPLIALSTHRRLRRGADPFRIRLDDGVEQ